MVPPKASFDYSERSKKFSRLFGAPHCPEGVESVTEEINSLPLHVPRRTDRDGEEKLAINALRRDDTHADDTLFRNDAEYVYLGRPLWASSIVHNRKLASWKEMLCLRMTSFLVDTKSLFQKECRSTLDNVWRSWLAAYHCNSIIFRGWRGS